MAKIPVEIFNYSDDFKYQIVESVKIANESQESIKYLLIDKIDKKEFSTLNSLEVNTKELFDEIGVKKQNIGGFHPYMLMVLDSPIYNNYYNIFGSWRAKSGIGVITTSNVAEAIIPKDKMKAYFIYYFAHYVLNFLSPGHKTHKETRGCIFDYKISKLDILESMKENAFCDECKKNLLIGDSKITIEILNAVNKLLGKSGEILNDLYVPPINTQRKKIFISYSQKDKSWKDTLRVHLKPLEKLAGFEVWSDEMINPGEKWFNEIKNAMAESRIGILLISPDFLASDFIQNVEIPKLLENVEREGGVVIPIIIRHSLFGRIERLARFQAINSPSNPIAILNEAKQDEIFVKIAKKIWDIIES